MDLADDVLKVGLQNPFASVTNNKGELIFEMQRGAPESEVPYYMYHVYWDRCDILDALKMEEMVRFAAETAERMGIRLFDYEKVMKAQLAAIDANPVLLEPGRHGFTIDVVDYYGREGTLDMVIRGDVFKKHPDVAP